MHCWIIFSGTPAENSSVAPVVLKLWFVLFPSTPASKHMFLSIEDNRVFPTGVDMTVGSDDVEGKGPK